MGKYVAFDESSVKDDSFGSKKPIVGISSCLLGNRVRYDGGHKSHSFLVGTLGKHVHWLHICPEVEMGMPTPREPIQLEGDPRQPRLMALESRKDHTEGMQEFCRTRLAQLASIELHGFIFKQNSPSCGVENLPVFSQKGEVYEGTGFFARALIQAHPLLPLEEETGMDDPDRRVSFLTRLHAYFHLCNFLKLRPDKQALKAFHERFKLIFMVQNGDAPGDMQLFLAMFKSSPAVGSYREYRTQFMHGLRATATRKKHVLVLKYICECLSNAVKPVDLLALHRVVEQYQKSTVPLVIPLRMIHSLRKGTDIPALNQQTYLDPEFFEIAFDGL